MYEYEFKGEVEDVADFNVIDHISVIMTYLTLKEKTS